MKKGHDLKRSFFNFSVMIPRISRYQNFADMKKEKNTQRVGLFCFTKAEPDRITTIAPMQNHVAENIHRHFLSLFDATTKTSEAASPTMNHFARNMRLTRGNSIASCRGWDEFTKTKRMSLLYSNFTWGGTKIYLGGQLPKCMK